MLGRVRVAGHSMEPALSHGDELLLIRAARPPIGAVVVARDPRDLDRLVVKRVAEVDGDDLTLASDRPDHERLRVDRRALIGRAILRYRPINRTSVIPARAERRTPAPGCC
ncbi:MAG TPA: S24 family peptidase [Candidatus Limnocylindria bacterium]